VPVSRKPLNAAIWLIGVRAASREALYWRGKKLSAQEWCEAFGKSFSLIYMVWTE
jgi:hypothetical protein